LLSAAKYLLFHADLAFSSTLAEDALPSADTRLNVAATPAARRAFSCSDELGENGWRGSRRLAGISLPGVLGRHISVVIANRIFAAQSLPERGAVSRRKRRKLQLRTRATSAGATCLHLPKGQ
jgi:hypothetical protein